MKNSFAYAAYSQNNTAIESPEKLIEMLYEGVLRFSAQAIKSIDSNNLEKKTYWINRATAIFAELLNSINYSGGDVAHYLSGLYTRQLQLLALANINNTKEPLEEVMKVTKGLLEAWRETTNL
ncbi:MAG: flagellar export chaperone FliS [Sulfurospirillaceae bacterium]|jgi:flagellar protein FliS|nr:flagellar export chaperone FliS [Sulfurospirillaceae bacterium]MCK9546535.1 flagellar export chaperone FliS [Sulfurospirillaceae bacterium]MDY0238404.1 flagellar export chaperone FliS [Campylobacterales bacterium]NLN00118.1 flagellar export chaperone FliS [Campylobacteraceae bacterium]